MKNWIIFLSLLLISTIAYAQQHEISGTVLVFNKFPLKNLKIIAKKAKTETITNSEGEFRLNVKKNDVLLIEAKAFERYMKRINDTDDSLSINLIYIDKKKNIDLAVDNGFIDREHLEYGLNNLAAENNIFSSFTNVFDAIEYAIPSATIITENGLNKVRIRGVKSTVGSNAALMVVNGYLSEDINYIIPSTIVSIKQLSPSAATIYGTGSGNGVIAITTK